MELDQADAGFSIAGGRKGKINFGSESGGVGGPVCGGGKRLVLVVWPGFSDRQ